VLKIVCAVYVHLECCPRRVFVSQNIKSLLATTVMKSSYYWIMLVWAFSISQRCVKCPFIGNMTLPCWVFYSRRFVTMHWFHLRVYKRPWIALFIFSYRWKWDPLLRFEISGTQYQVRQRHNPEKRISPVCVHWWSWNLVFLKEILPEVRVLKG